MRDGQSQGRRAIGAGSIVLLIVAVPLWNEFRVRGNLAWNVFLGVFLCGLAVAAIMLQHYLRQHPSEIGEARFDTTNTADDS
jgi:hypothetical protein